MIEKINRFFEIACKVLILTLLFLISGIILVGACYFLVVLALFIGGVL